MDEENRGYSAYFFNRDNDNEECIVRSEETYRNNRILIVMSVAFLQLFVYTGVPAAIYHMYEPVHKRAERKKSNFKYFLWSILVLSVLVALLVLTVDIWTLIDFGINRELSSQSDVVANFVIAGVAIVMFLILDAIFACWLTRTGVLKQDFPTPPVLYFLCCCCFTNTILLQSFLIYFLMLSIQLLSFHALMVFLGFIASPTQAISLLAFYFAAAFCLITCTAAFLKAVKFRKATLKGFDKKKCERFSKGLVTVLLACLFAAFIAFFIAVFLQVVILVGDQGSGQVNAFVGSLVPSLILGVLGVLGERVVEFEGTEKESDVEEANNDRKQETREVIAVDTGL